MQIDIGYDFRKNEVIINDNKKDKDINLEEKEILQNIILQLKNEFNEDDFKIESKTKNYLTLSYKKFDIVRVKYTSKSKWISVFIVDKDLIKEYESSPLFAIQKNKNQMQWKSELNNKNIDKYIKILKVACNHINK